MRKSWWMLLVLILAVAIPFVWNESQSKAQTQVQVETVVGNLGIPWSVDFAPDGRIFFTERAGFVRVIRDSRVDP